LEDEMSFKVSHGGVTTERAVLAAETIERHIGEYLNGDRRALNKIPVEDMIVLIQFARNEAGKEG
jgi:hypothetical protein